MHPLLILRTLPNGRGETRFGFTVASRVGKAVVRNRVRRRLREGARLTPVRGGWDVVFIARPPAAQADYWGLKSAVQELLRRARLLPPEVGSQELW